MLVGAMSRGAILTMVRIISGRWGGRRLEAPADRHIRPTADRVREAVFNRLYSLGEADPGWAIDGARLADLFAGTGAFGIEALSRGAQHVVFIDSDPEAVGLVESNLASLDADGNRFEILRADVIDNLSRRALDVDLAFADPPYDFDGWTRLLDVVAVPRLVVESSSTLPEHRSWRDIASRAYGTTVVTFLEHVAPGDEESR